MPKPIEIFRNFGKEARFLSRRCHVPDRLPDVILHKYVQNVTQTTTKKGGAITTTISSPVTAGEKIKKKNDVKERRSQITDKSKNGLGFQSYNVVLPPATLVYNTRRCPPPKTDLSYSGLEKFKQSQFEIYGPKSSEIESKNASEDISNELKEYPDAPLVKNRVLDNKDYSVESPVMVEKKTVVLTIAKVKVVRPKQQEKPVRKIVRYAEMHKS
nr:hypothetical protein [Tanacetum cinerariifolium]